MRPLASHLDPIGRPSRRAIGPAASVRTCWVGVRAGSPARFGANNRTLRQRILGSGGLIGSDQIGSDVISYIRARDFAG